MWPRGQRVPLELAAGGANWASRPTGFASGLQLLGTAAASVPAGPVGGKRRCRCQETLPLTDLSFSRGMGKLCDRCRNDQKADLPLEFGSVMMQAVTDTNAS